MGEAADKDGLTIVKAMRTGPPELVAELDQLQARLRPERLEQLGWTERLEVSDQLRKVWKALWQHLLARLIAGDLTLSWQSTAAAERRTLPTNLCAALRLTTEGRLFLDGKPREPLNHVLIHQAATSAPVSGPVSEVAPPARDDVADDTAAKRERWMAFVKSHSGRTEHALVAWARAKFGERQPGRDELLDAHRNDFGKISGISDKPMMRLLRNALAPGAKGGASTHRHR
jgi:hypothetical protein